MLSASDLSLELLPWTVVIDKSVNPVLPDGYRAVNTPDGLASYIVGPAWSGALAKLERPMIPGCYRPSLTVLVKPDASTVINAQALEFDLRIQYLGMNYNFSSQINYAEGGMLQVSTKAGGWVDTGCKVGILPAGTWSTLQFNYSFDPVKKTFSIVTVSVNGLGFTIPASLQTVPASVMNWQDGLAVIQIQIDLNGNGGACSHQTKVSLAWN